MKKFLSIDWDYFIDCSADTRNDLFPDGGNENISFDIQKLVWDSHYSQQGDKIRKIGVLNPDYDIITDILNNFRQKYMPSRRKQGSLALITISHLHIFDFIMKRTKPNEEFEVYNIDFHHDLFCYMTREQEVNCGNWALILKEKRPNMKYHWVKRGDSLTKVIGGEQVDAIINTMEDIRYLDPNYIFMCRSDCWSPPHLDEYFEELRLSLTLYLPVEYEALLDPPRDITEMNLRERGLELALAISKVDNNTCLYCGRVVPEGSIVCPTCTKDPQPKMT